MRRAAWPACQATGARTEQANVARVHRESEGVGHRALRLDVVVRIHVLCRPLLRLLIAAVVEVLHPEGISRVEGKVMGAWHHTTSKSAA